MNNNPKYVNNKNHEPLLDNYLFFPIADKLVDPLYKMRMKPNDVTILSTFFTLLTIYFLQRNNKILAVSSYLFGYILDCVDGKMARKYKLHSEFGMVLDSTSDHFSNIILLIFIIYNYKMKDTNLGFLCISIFLFILFSIAYSINEAISSYNKTGDDNYYKHYEYQLKNKDNDIIKIILYKYYLYVFKKNYEIYRKIFPKYDKNKINKWLPILKEFGPGTYNLFFALFIYCLKN